MSNDSLNLDKMVTVRSRLEKWAGLVKDRDNPMTDPRCYEIIEIVDYPDGRRDITRVKGAAKGE